MVEMAFTLEKMYVLLDFNFISNQIYTKPDLQYFHYRMSTAV